MNLFVSNLHWFEVDESALRDLFSQFGQVIRVHLARDRETDKSRGFAFVELTTREDGERAILELNRTTFRGRTLFVHEAEER